MALAVNHPHAAQPVANRCTQEFGKLLARLVAPPGYTRFELRDAPAVLRLQLENVFNTGGWKPTSSGGFEREDPRTVSIELAADF